MKYEKGSKSGSGSGHKKGRLTLKGDFGFVAFEEPDQPDLRISGSDLGSAMHNDIVMVSETSSSGDRRTRGRIEKVIERATSTVVGTIDIRRGLPVLITDRATEPIRLISDSTSMDLKAARSGLRAIAEIRSFPTASVAATGVITAILGQAGDPAVELEASKIAMHVPKSFPEPVLRAALALPDRVYPEDVAGRLDLRDLVTFTIDPTDARDFDDAISIETLPGNKFRLGIHIADVAHYVKEGSEIDVEAYKRATSTYLPGVVIPMLPERLSNGLCSLVEGEDRLAATIFVELDAAFVPVTYRHVRSVIRSKRRFTYDEVDVILDTGEGDLKKEIQLLRRLAQKFYDDRVKRGALDFDIPENKPILDLNGKIVAVKTIERTWSHRLIEELMIHANEYVARAMGKKGIYRIHEAPSPDKMMRLRQIASVVGQTAARGSIQRILAGFSASPAKRVIEYLVLRAMQEARYSAINVGHFGLASEAYSHFTSPIRRYPDLIAHRILFGERSKLSMHEAALHTSRREREAMEAERDAVTIKLLEYARMHLGETVKGVVNTVTKDGLWLVLDFGPRGLVQVNELGREEFRFERDSMSLVGRRTRKRYAMGDEMNVVIASVDIGQRQLLLTPVGAVGAGVPAPRAKPHPKRREKPHSKLKRRPQKKGGSRRRR